MGQPRFRHRMLPPPLDAPRLGPPAAKDRLVPGTHVTVEEVIDMMMTDHRCDRLFRWYPDLDPDAVREAIDGASRPGCD